MDRAVVRYGTARFQKGLSSEPGRNDLLAPETGAPDPQGATLDFPLDPEWDDVDERREIRHSVAEFVEHLNEHVEHYHKAIWWNMDRDRLLMMLDGFYVPWAPDVSVASVVEREPIAIAGNSVVYTVSPAMFLKMSPEDSRAALHNRYATDKAISDPMHVSLPTEGLYAQSVLDECVALEEHRGSTDWVLDQADIDPDSLDPSLLGSRRAEPGGATAPTSLPASIINLQNAPAAPPPSGLEGVLAAVTSANAFRDMAGLAGTQANAAAAMQTAAALATNFGNQAAALRIAKQAADAQKAKNANEKIAAVEGAKRKDLVGEEDARQHTNKILEQLYQDPADESGFGEGSVFSDALRQGTKMPGTQFEASTPTGQLKMTLARTGGNDPVPPPLNLDFSKSILGWTGAVQLVPEPFRTMLEQQLSAGREEWLTTNRARRNRFPNEPVTNLDGLPIPPWVEAKQVFDNLRAHYNAQHAALSQADQNLNYSRIPDQVLGANPANPITSNYFVVHDTAGTGERTAASNNAGVHLWIGTRSLARGGDWDVAGDATKLEFGGTTCFVHVELTRATSGSITSAAPNNYPNTGISTARAAGTRYTDQQYDDMANAYIVACIRRGRFLTVTAHKELDRSAVRRGDPSKLGHSDPEDLDIERFYLLVAQKLVLPVDTTFGIAQQRVDSGNLDGHVNAFVDYAFGSAAAANQYDWPIPRQDQNPNLPQGDSVVPPYSSTNLYVMPLQDANGNNVLNAGNGNWEAGEP